MKRFVAAMAVVAVSGCAPGPSSSALAGAWSSAAFAIMTNDSSRAVFATSEITIGTMGELTGSVRSIRPTSVEGEMGTVSGSIVVNGPASAAVNATISFPTLGMFRVSGMGSYTATSLGISGSSVRDASGNLVGSIAAVYNR